MSQKVSYHITLLGGRGFLLLLLLSLLAAELPSDPVRYTRFEAQYTPSLYIDMLGGKALSCDLVAFELYPLLTAQERWFIAREIEFLNKERGLPVLDGIMLVPDGIQIPVPVYRRSSKFFCGDIRNWHVAVMKGRKYGVHPALMIAVRTQENPLRRRDWYAYGVVHLRGTDLWTQADGAGKIIAWITKAQGWSPMEPTWPRLLRLARVYVGQGERSAEHWSRNVWALYQRATP